MVVLIINNEEGTASLALFQSSKPLELTVQVIPSADLHAFVSLSNSLPLRLWQVDQSEN